MKEVLKYKKNRKITTTERKRKKDINQRLDVRDTHANQILSKKNQVGFLVRLDH